MLVDKGDKFMNKLYWTIGASMIAIPVALTVVLLITTPTSSRTIVLATMLFVIVAIATSLFIFRPEKGRTISKTTSAIFTMCISIGLVLINIHQINDKRAYNTLWWISLLLMTIGLALVGMTFFFYARQDKDKKIFWLFSGSFVIVMVILGTVIRIAGM